jgi:hypothetical protein
VRVVVVSHHPALALALGAQVPGWDPVEARDLDDAVRLADAGAVVVVDPGDTAEPIAWATALRQRGVSGGLVVVAEVPEPVHDLDRVVWITRPFDLDDLAAALASAGRGEAATMPEAPTTGPMVERGDVPDPAASDHSGESVIELPEVGAPVPVSAPSAPEAPTAHRAAPGPMTQWFALPESFRWRRRGAEQEAAREPASVASERDLRRRTHDALEGARSLEVLLADMPALADPGACGEAVLDEIRSRMAYVSAAVALADRTGALVLVAGDGITRASRSHRCPRPIRSCDASTMPGAY